MLSEKLRRKEATELAKLNHDKASIDNDLARALQGLGFGKAGLAQATPLSLPASPQPPPNESPKPHGCFVCFFRSKETETQPPLKVEPPGQTLTANPSTSGSGTTASAHGAATGLDLDQLPYNANKQTPDDGMNKS